MDLYECRRCTPAVKFAAYQQLRVHLRTVHRINQLPNAEICLYELFPGSHARSTAVDPMIPLRDEMAHIINASIDRHISSIRPPPSIDLGQVEAAINSARAGIANTPPPIDVNRLVIAIRRANDTIRTIPSGEIPLSLERSINDTRAAVRNFRPAVLETPVRLCMEPITNLLRATADSYASEIRSSVETGIKLALTALYDQLNRSNASSSGPPADEHIVESPEMISVSQIMSDLVSFVFSFAICTSLTPFYLQAQGDQIEAEVPMSNTDSLNIEVISFETQIYIGSNNLLLSGCTSSSRSQSSKCC